MELPKKLIDLATVESANEGHKERIYHFKNLVDSWVNDTKRSERLKDQECVICYYSNRVAGQAMTRRPCGLCEQEIQWGNTSCPVLCKACAGRAKLCHQCGADIDLKNRRKRDL